MQQGEENRLKTTDYPRTGVSVGAKFQKDLIARQDLDVVDPHLPGEVREHHFIRSDAHPECCRRQSLLYPPLQNLYILIWHYACDCTKQ